MRERAFQDALTEFATLRGWLWYHTHTSLHSPAGFPDLVLVRGARLLFVEVKGDGGELSDKQELWIAALRGAGQECYVWWPKDYDAAIAILNARDRTTAAYELDGEGATTRLVRTR